MLSNRLSVIAAALSNDPREAARLARVAGFKGLLLDTWSTNLSVPDLSTTGRRELVHMLTSQDQQLVGLRLDLGAKGLSIGADVDRQIERIDSAMESAAGLRSPLVCVDLGPLPRVVAAPKPKASVPSGMAGLIIIPETQPALNESPVATPPDPAFVSQVQSALSEIGSRADRYGVMLACSSSLASFASLRESVSAARCPWLGIDLDPIAILRDDLSSDQIFSIVGGLIHHVRARDAIVGESNRTSPTIIGHGGTNWIEFLAHLDAAGYGGFITIDPMELTDRPGAAVDGRARLVALSEAR